MTTSKQGGFSDLKDWPHLRVVSRQSSARLIGSFCQGIVRTVAMLLQLIIYLGRDLDKCESDITRICYFAHRVFLTSSIALDPELASNASVSGRVSELFKTRNSHNAVGKNYLFL